MGVSIDLYIYNYDSLRKKLSQIGAKDPLLSQILEECGTVFGDAYVILNNELWDGYSPFYNVATLIDSAFNVKDSFDVFLNTRESGINAVELYDVAERLEITLDEET